MSDKQVTIIANGESEVVALPCTVEGFLKSCGWRKTQVVVELNGRVLARSDLEKNELSEGDRLEVIVPVAGG